MKGLPTVSRRGKASTLAATTTNTLRLAGDGGRVALRLICAVPFDSVAANEAVVVSVGPSTTGFIIGVVSPVAPVLECSRETIGDLITGPIYLRSLLGTIQMSVVEVYDTLGAE